MIKHRCSALALALVLGLSLVAACGGDDDTTQPATDPVEDSAPTDDAPSDDESGDLEETGMGGSITFGTSDNSVNFLANVTGCESSGETSLTLEGAANGYEVEAEIVDGAGSVEVTGAGELTGSVETVRVSEGDDGVTRFQVIGVTDADEEVTFDLTGDCR